MRAWESVTTANASDALNRAGDERKLAALEAP